MRTDSDVVYSTQTFSYQQYEDAAKDPYNLVCIDGKKVGRHKCVGYCRLDAHSGFLQKKHIEKHNCLGKECVFFIKKPSVSNNKPKLALPRTEYRQQEEAILKSANEQTMDCEALRFINAHHIKDNVYQLTYVSISNEYDLSVISNRISKLTDTTIETKEIICDLQEKVKLILSKDNK